MAITTEHLEAMLAAATPGPWQVSIDDGDEVMTGAGGESLMCDMTYYPWVPPSDDWPLIAAAPTITAELIAARKRIASLEDALVGIKRASEARMREALERADRALKPFADTVFNDNGDCTISDTYLLTDVDFCNAYSARNIARAALQGETK